ncbi:hypothetical protein [Helicobacter ailurogastricus]|uniref:hypothetical protein n=1 Tax=Helicobacter ailurogastricus TaxID=1578720 RepID=UPI001E636987|nr:hypothetical protein [Helicobacter ailurogastricus]
MFKKFAIFKVQRLLEKIQSKLLMRKIKANHLWLRHASALSFEELLCFQALKALE